MTVVEGWRQGLSDQDHAGRGGPHRRLSGGGRLRSGLSAVAAVATTLRPTTRTAAVSSRPVRLRCCKSGPTPRSPRFFSCRRPRSRPTCGAFSANSRARVDRRLVGDDPDRGERGGVQCPGEEPAGGRQIPLLRHRNIDDLAEFISSAYMRLSSVNAHSPPVPASQGCDACSMRASSPPRSNSPTPTGIRGPEVTPAQLDPSRGPTNEE